MRVVCKPISVADVASSGEVSVVVSEEVISSLDRLNLNIRSDYYTTFNRTHSVSYKITAEEYLFGKDEKWSDTSLLCPEMPVPHHIASSVRLRVPTGDSWTKQAVALLHAGRKESTAPVHFDWDHTWVAHACLIGRKRFFIFPPHAGWLLSPVINTSALLIPKFSETDRHELINRLGGMEIILEAGQGIRMPSMFWHGVLYDEPSLAVSVRYEPYPGGRPFAALPRSWLLQRLVWRFFQHGYGPEAYDFLVEYLKSFFRPTKRWKDKYRRIAHLCRDVLLAYGERQGASGLVAENFSTELALASQELRLYYSDVNGLNQDENDLVLEAQDYIFEAIKRPPDAQDLQLAKYARKVRQGLPPKRGLVEIERE